MSASGILSKYVNVNSIKFENIESHINAKNIMKNGDAAMKTAWRKYSGLVLFIILLPLPFAVSAENDVILKVTSNPNGAMVYVEGLNKTFYTPATLEIPKGNWVLKISNGKYTILYNLTARGDAMKIFVDFTNMKHSIHGPFINGTIKYGFNLTVPTKEEEYVPFIPAPPWSEDVCGGIFMFGPINPPMGIYMYEPKEHYYQLVLNNTPTYQEYRGRKGCLIVEELRYYENGGGMARFGEYKNASFVTPNSLLHVDSKPQNATVYIFDFHRFGEWFTPFDVLVPVIMTPQRDVTAIVKYDNSTRWIPYIPELHRYKISMGYNGYPFFEGWVDVKPNENYSVSVNLELLKFALRVNGKPVEQQIKEKHEPPRIYIPNTTLLIVNSTPSAELLMDGKSLGKTPVEEEVSGGEHEFALKIGGCIVWRKSLNIGYGGRFRLTVYLEEYIKKRGFMGRI